MNAIPLAWFIFLHSALRNLSKEEALFSPKEINWRRKEERESRRRRGGFFPPAKKTRHTCLSFCPSVNKENNWSELFKCSCCCLNNCNTHIQSLSAVFVAQSIGESFPLFFYPSSLITVWQTARCSCACVEAWRKTWGNKFKPEREGHSERMRKDGRMEKRERNIF